MQEIKEAASQSLGVSGIVEEEKQKLEDYEEAFQCIKEATGVMDVNEVIQKFLTQEETQKDLHEEKKQRHSQIDRLTDELRKLREQVEHLKFSSGSSANRRQAIDEREDKINQAMEKLQRNRGKYERVAKILVDMKAGIEHLGEKLMRVKLESEGTFEMSDETVEDYVQQCELKVSELMSLTRGAEDGLSDRNQLEDAYDSDKPMRTSNHMGIRIKLAEEEEVHEDEEGSEDEIDEDVVHRRQAKYNSDQILLRQQTKNRRGKMPARSPRGGR